MSARRQNPLIQDAEFVKKYGPLDNGALADRFGQAKAVLAQATEVEEELKAELRRRRFKRYVGKLFEVTVTRAERESISIAEGSDLREAVIKKLGRAFLKRYITHGTSTTVRCTARKKDQAPPKRRKAAA